MGFSFNPLGPPFDIKGKKQEPFFPHTRICCGKISDLDPDGYNSIDCCKLPFDSSIRSADLGELNALCN